MEDPERLGLVAVEGTPTTKIRERSASRRPFEVPAASPE